jgi:hypothetical protein
MSTDGAMTLLIFVPLGAYAVVSGIRARNRTRRHARLQAVRTAERECLDAGPEQWVAEADRAVIEAHGRAGRPGSGRYSRRVPAKRQMGFGSRYPHL